MLLSELLRQRVIVALVLAASWSASCDRAAAQERPSDTFRASAASLLPSFIQVNASFASCGGKKGFAFVIGESDDKVFLAVPDHVIHCQVFTPPIAEAVQLGGYSSDGRSFRLGRADPIALPAADNADAEDIAFLSVSKPQTWTTKHTLMADAAELTNGTAVTFLGYLERPIIPQQLGVVVDACDTAYTTKVCGVLVERLPTQVGTSGAVVFNEQGHVVGLNILGERDQSLAVALRLDEIRRIAEKARVPWNVYTDAEELKFGERLGRAINTGDRETFKAVVAKRINLDRSYKFNDQNSPYPPLAVAGWANQIDMAVTLIKSGARAHYGPAIGAAMAARRYDALKVMLDAGMGTACPFNSALSNGDQTSIKMMLAANSPELVTGNCEGLTPANAAIKAGREDVAASLFKLRPASLGDEDKLLVSAILKGQSSMVEKLLSSGAGKGLVGNDATGSPLHAAAFVGNSQLVERLLAMGVPVDLRDDQGGLYGPTPFESAIFGGNFQIARLLAKRGGSPLGYRFGKERIFNDLILYRLTDAQQQQAKSLVIELATDYCSKLRQNQFSQARDFQIQQRNCGNL
ncbi:ankyrin repeat protein [Bradyrhizobium sp. USDA 3240]